MSNKDIYFKQADLQMLTHSLNMHNYKYTYKVCIVGQRQITLLSFKANDFPIMFFFS